MISRRSLLAFLGVAPVAAPMAVAASRPRGNWSTPVGDEIVELDRAIRGDMRNWMAARTRAPYLPCDGSIYRTADYPRLGLMLGSTFGGNGITTFAVPDLRPDPVPPGSAPALPHVDPLSGNYTSRPVE